MSFHADAGQPRPRRARPSLAPQTPSGQRGRPLEAGGVRAQVAGRGAAEERDGRQWFGRGAGRPDWQHPRRRATIPSTPPTVRGNQPRELQQQLPEADDVEASGGADLAADVAPGGCRSRGPSRAAPTTRRLARRFFRRRRSGCPRRRSAKRNSRGNSPPRARR